MVSSVNLHAVSVKSHFLARFISMFGRSIKIHKTNLSLYCKKNKLVLCA